MIGSYLVAIASEAGLAAFGQAGADFAGFAFDEGAEAGAEQGLAVDRRGTGR